MGPKASLLVGLVVLGTGIGCLNYTKAFGVENHHRWAEETGFPAPSGPIYFAGLGLTVLGGILVGSGLARRGGSRTPGRGG